MKAFNLEEYLKNPSQTVVTRNGRKVRIICTDVRSTFPVIALAERFNSEMDDAFSYTKDGRFLITETDERDLFFAPEKHEGYVNVIRNEVYNEAFCGKIYASKEEAEQKANNATIATAKIEWEE